MRVTVSECISQVVHIRDKLKQLLNSAPPYNQGAIFIINLDNFSTINNLLNSYRGDLLLQQVGTRIADELGMRDTLSQQGDEFILILNGLDSIYPTAMIAQNILKTLSAPFQIENQTAHISASIGISFYSYTTPNPDATLINANTALIQAKSVGKNNYQFYTQELGESTSKRHRIEDSLRNVLENDELFLCYQPIVEVQGGNIIAMEALLRWQNPTLGLIMPADFILLTEKTELIVPIGDWVLHTACMQAVQWQQPNKPLRMSVNISVQQFQTINGLGTDHLIKTIMAALERSQLAPELLELEITENVMMKSPALSITAIKKLKKLGVRIACDDFGTGYSSLNYLKHFPIDTIKIDKTFIHDIAHNCIDIAILEAIISMAQKLNIDVIAEGIEDSEQISILSNMGCHIIQGFYFSIPLQATEAALFLHNFQHIHHHPELWDKKPVPMEQTKQANNK